MRVSDYRQQKKKDGCLKSLSQKAFGGVGDFFSGLLDMNIANTEDNYEEDNGDSKNK